MPYRCRMPPAEALAEIAARHRVDPRQVTAVPGQGVANRVYFLGDRLVLRVARPQTADDLRKEAIVIPAAVRAGVRTPEVVTFDDSGALLRSPYMVLRRAHGIAPGLPRDPRDRDWARAYRRLGRELAVLHERVEELPRVPTEPVADPRGDLADLADAGYLGADVAGWLEGWFDRLEPLVPARPRKCSIHGDASPQNLLADPGSKQLTALVDWGDAAWADPATEFAKLPLRAVPLVLEGYLGEPDTSWAARILWHHLRWAVGRLATPAESRSAHWSAQPGNRLLEILRFFNADPPRPWPELR